MIILVLWEGLLGGATYVNAFYHIAKEVSRWHCVPLYCIPCKVKASFVYPVCLLYHTIYHSHKWKAAWPESDLKSASLGPVEDLSSHCVMRINHTDFPQLFTKDAAVSLCCHSEKYIRGLGRSNTEACQYFSVAETQQK